MVRLWIDDVAVEVPDGATVLEAAAPLGLDIPALCNHPDFPPNTSCMCCLVRVDGDGPRAVVRDEVREGMHVESETAAVRELRRTGLELLLGDHAGDCHAPCENTCPARMDIPDMLRHVVDGDYAAAIAVVKQDIALPAMLGRVCPEVCETACRRGAHDSPASICRIKRFVADRDLSTDSPYRPPIAPPTGRRVAIVGGGPTGLTAAYHLALAGISARFSTRSRNSVDDCGASFRPRNCRATCFKPKSPPCWRSGFWCEPGKRLPRGGNSTNWSANSTPCCSLSVDRPANGSMAWDSALRPAAWPPIRHRGRRVTTKCMPRATPSAATAWSCNPWRKGSSQRPASTPISWANRPPTTAGNLSRGSSG